MKIPYDNDNIKVWSSSEKGTLVVPDGSNYYKRWQLGSQPSTLYVEGCSAGEANLWLLYTPDGQNYPGGTKNHDPVKFTVYKAELKSIWFKSDHGLLKDNNSDWTDSGTTYSQPEWIPDGPDAGTDPDQNNPISHTKNIQLTADVKVCVEPSGLTFDLIGDGPDNYVDFNKTNITSAGYDQIVTVSANANLPNQVDTLTKSISWTIKLLDPDPDIEVDVGSSGPHKIYVTYGTPTGSVVTEKRMSWACSTATGQSSLTGIADEIYDDFSTPPPYFQLGADAPDPLWLLMAGSQYKGECVDQANLMKLAVQILGGSASIGYVYGSSDTTCYSTSYLAHESRYCGTHGTEKIYVYAGGGWNNWEAVCVVSGKYYAIQLYSHTVPVEILRYWLGSNQPSGNHQAWKNAGGVCQSPGPYPVPKP